MKHSFDIVREPWISVRCLDGKLIQVGMRDLFLNAHKYERVEEPNTQHEYGIINLALAFLYNVYPMHDLCEKGVLYEKGKFDISTFDTYILKCEQNRPNCFNLFGDNPFYQNSKMIKGKPVMVGKIALEIPSGNNTVHFASEPQIGKKLNFVEVTKALCSYTLFQASQDASNSAVGPNGSSYPEYFILKAETLFEQLILNAITETSFKSRTSEDSKYLGNVVWEDTNIYEAKSATKQVTLVEGLTFQNRNVLLGDITEDNLVENIYFGAGRKFEKLVERKPSDRFKSATDSSWRLPNGVYYYKNVPKGKKDFESVLKVLTPNGYKKIWLDMPLFFKIKDKYSICTVEEFIALKYKDIVKMNKLYYSIYYISIDGGQYPPLQNGVYENYLPVSFLENDLLMDNFNDIIQLVVDIGNCIFSDIVPFSLSDIYYSKVELEKLPYIISEFDKISKDFDDDDEILQNINYKIIKELKDLVDNIYKSYVLANPTTFVYETEKNKMPVKVGFYGKVNKEIRIIMSRINKIIKERGFIKDDEGTSVGISESE